MRLLRTVWNDEVTALVTLAMRAVNINYLEHTSTAIYRWESWHRKVRPFYSQSIRNKSPASRLQVLASASAIVDGPSISLQLFRWLRSPQFDLQRLLHTFP